MNLTEAANRFYYEMTLSELRLMHQKVGAPNITYNSLLYLDLISYRQDCTVSWLAEVLHVAKSSVTLKVGELMRLGLVEKTQSPQDKRVYYITVSPQAAEQYEVYNRLSREAAARMQQKYTQQEIDLFCGMVVSFSEFYGEVVKDDKHTG